MKTISPMLALSLIGVLVDTQTNEPSKISEGWESVKGYFKGLNLEVQDKFSAFGSWMKETYNSGADKGKTQLDHIKSMADTFVSHSKEMSHDVAEQGEEFFRPYKNELGSQWDRITNKVHETVEKGQKEKKDIL